MGITGIEVQKNGNNSGCNPSGLLLKSPSTVGLGLKIQLEHYFILQGRIQDINTSLYDFTRTASGCRIRRLRYGEIRLESPRNPSFRIGESPQKAERTVWKISYMSQEAYCGYTYPI